MITTPNCTSLLLMYKSNIITQCMFITGDGEDEEMLQEDEKKLSLSKGERSHLIVWEVTSTQ